MFHLFPCGSSALAVFDVDTCLTLQSPLIDWEKAFESPVPTPSAMRKVLVRVEHVHGGVLRSPKNQLKRAEEQSGNSSAKRLREIFLPRRLLRNTSFSAVLRNPRLKNFFDIELVPRRETVKRDRCCHFGHWCKFQMSRALTTVLALSSIRQFVPPRWRTRPVDLVNSAVPCLLFQARSVQWIPTVRYFSSCPPFRQTAQPSEANEESTPSQVTANQGSNIKKRKSARSAARKASLRRVAVEAQRSKGGDHSSKANDAEKYHATRQVTAYAVAEEFDLVKVKEVLRSQGYEPDPFRTNLDPQVVHVQIPLASIHRTAKTSIKTLSSAEVGNVFIFPSGTIVSWSLPEQFTSYFAGKTLLAAAKGPHLDVESEDLEYVEDPSRDHSSIKGDTIVLGMKQDPSASKDGLQIDSVLTKIAFSSGFARSTKLAVLESMLQDYFDSTRNIPMYLSQGSKLPYDRSFILRKTGQLLSLRAQLNLYSELTDSLPDLFWNSRHELGLEGYYDQVGRALDVGIRIKVLNEKMDYAQEIASVLRERLSEKHGLVLEWTIITLIAVEVGFEILRLWKEGWLWEKTQPSSSTSEQHVLAS